MHTKEDLLENFNSIKESFFKKYSDDILTLSMFYSKNSNELKQKIENCKSSFIQELLELINYYDIYKSDFLLLLIIDLTLVAKESMDFSYSCGMSPTDSKHNGQRLKNIIKECEEVQKYSKQDIIFNKIPILPIKIQNGINKQLEMLNINADINLHIINLISGTDRKSLPRYEKKIKDQVENYQNKLREKLIKSIE